MTDPATVARDLREHLALCQECLRWVERESPVRSAPDTAPGSIAASAELRQSLVRRLDQSLTRLRQHRAAWQRLSPAERQRHPEVTALLRANQDAILKVLLLFREREQARRPPGVALPKQTPSAVWPRPHFVADLYRRHSA